MNEMKITTLLIAVNACIFAVAVAAGWIAGSAAMSVMA